MGCGRREKAHALEHFRAKHDRFGNHAVALDLNDLLVWCYVCDDYVVGARETMQWLEPEAAPREDVEMEVSVSGVAGLQNLGNTCYMNAALQVMLNCPSIRGYFSKCSQFILNRPSRDISGAFLELCDSVYLQHSKAASVSPRSIVRQVKMVNPMFEGYSQQDTMDFMRCLWDRLHEELMDPISSSNSENSSPSKVRRSDRLASSPSFTPFVPKHRSIISDTFGGVLQSRIDCLSCKGVSIKEDPFFDLSLPIVLSTPIIESPSSSTTSATPKSPTLEYMGNIFNSIGESLGFSGKSARLEACLAAFCSPERLEGRDRYYCEKCKAKVPSLKTLSLHKLPNVLCIQLKRFKHESFFSSKVNTQVVFPVDNMDMSPFCQSASQGPLEYELIAVINHLGSFSGGHYTAHCRHQDIWLKFDDSYVSEVSIGDISTSQAYCLVYRRKFTPRSIPPVQDGPKCALSRQWFNNWKHLADPGPVSSAELCCPHHQLTPDLVRTQQSMLAMTVELSVEVVRQFEQQFSTVGDGKSHLNLPLQICTECIDEARELELKRKSEAEAIAELDTRQINNAEGEQWHLIETSWLNEFLAFRDGNQRHPPGPICNHRLLDDQQERPKNGLKRGIHYRAVNGQVWDYLMGRYGGGPPIRRDTVDIYGPSRSSNSTIDITIPKRPPSESSGGGDSPRRISPRRQPNLME